MSDRRHIGQYGHFNPNQYGGVVSWLPQLLGKDQVTGGWQVDPQTGKYIFIPYQGSSGFFGRASRQEALARNDVAQAALAAQQHQAELEKEIQKMRSETELSVQERANQGRVKEQKVAGKQARKTAIYKQLTDLGMVPEKGLPQVVAKTINPAILERLGIIEGYKTGFSKTPEFQQSVGQDMLAQNQKQAITNAKTGELSAAPGEFKMQGLIPGVNTGWGTPLGSVATVQGSGTSETQTQNTFTDPKTGMSIPMGPAMTTRTPVPPRVSLPVDPAIIKQIQDQLEEERKRAQSQQNSQGTITNPAFLPQSTPVPPNWMNQLYR